MFKPRDIYADILAFLPDKRFSVITGARQTGKTSLLRTLYADLKNRQEQVFYLSFEDPAVVTAANEHPDKLFDFVSAKPLRALDGAAPQRIFVLIDEVQYAREPSHFLKYLYDTYEGNLKVVATGSSAFYIDQKFRDSLAGRKRIFRLNTLNFREFLVFREWEHLALELDALRGRPDYQSLRADDLRRAFWEYLRFGGYPAVALEATEREKRFTLDELKNSYVRRDVQESKIAHELKFYRLFQMLADQTGNLLNKNELAGEIQLDSKTVDNYVYVLEKCFHISLLRPYFRNLRKELTKMPKVYLNDLGMRNALLNRFEEMPNRSDKGQLLENYFFLRMNELFTSDQLFFWRTADGLEVDFVVRDTIEAGQAFEVKWSESKAGESKYSIFAKANPHFPLRFLTAEQFWQP
ncbi:MAG TPA: ATP-binding protein [Saprospiraceae bacterium]|nr:ATP-binding protein [Saprospiraceae bacterium]